MTRTNPLSWALFLALLAIGPTSIAAQSRKPARIFEGNWHWAVFATSRDELPPAYQDMDLKDVPAYAVDLTLRQRANRIRGDFGILARYLARVDDGSFVSTIRGRTLRLKVTSNFGGSASVLLTVSGNTLRWQTLNSTGEHYFPKDIVLRRLRRGEKPPYASEDQQR